jgi:5-methylcytosine-specific restriction enzyme subunit McrC
VKRLCARDLSPLDDLKRGDEAWLQHLADQVRASEHIVRLGAAAEDPEPIVSRAYDGRWRTGRYIGSISFEGRCLDIEPRLAPEALRQLLRTAVNVIIPTRSGELQDTSTVVPLLLALVWCRELDAATRHGLPFLRIPARHQGLFVRGRVEERRTQGLRRRGTLAVSSVSAERSLDNDIARTLVCGQRALTKLLGGDSWMTRRARDTMPHLWAAVGMKPALPSAFDLRRIRYTPIRLPYRGLVQLSWELARGRGLRSAGEGEAEGLLIDMAELWERYVFACVQRAAAPTDEVFHEAAGDGRKRHLYRSTTRKATMGRLLPDIVVYRKRNAVAIFDAKYKLISDRGEAPQGVTREDRYQLAGYLATLGHRDMVGMLAYPAELDNRGKECRNEQQAISSAEAEGPWSGPADTTALFSRISFDPERATRQLRAALSTAPGRRAVPGEAHRTASLAAEPGGASAR